MPHWPPFGPLVCHRSNPGWRGLRRKAMEKPSQHAGSCQHWSEQKHATFASLGQKKGDYRRCRGHYEVP